MGRNNGDGEDQCLCGNSHNQPVSGQGEGQLGDAGEDNCVPDALAGDGCSHYSAHANSRFEETVVSGIAIANVEWCYGLVSLASHSFYLRMSRLVLLS